MYLRVRVSRTLDLAGLYRRRTSRLMPSLIFGFSLHSSREYFQRRTPVYLLRGMSRALQDRSRFGDPQARTVQPGHLDRRTRGGT